jgi:hypothetical protein
MVPGLLHYSIMSICLVDLVGNVAMTDVAASFQPSLMLRGNESEGGVFLALLHRI